MVGAETAERIKKYLVLEDTGQHQLKNISQPVQVFRLVLPVVYAKITARISAGIGVSGIGV